jgi:tetratricopeptide (TPR) repeat protein
VLALKADQPDLLGNRASTLLKLKRLPEAIACYEQARQLAPRNAIILSNLSGALRESARHAEALAMADRAIEVDPKLGGAHMNRGNALLDLVRLDEARQAFAMARQVQPEDVEVQWALGWTSLLAGDWATGLPLFEVRWKKPGFSSEPRGFTQPLWLGDSDLRGRTILLHAEQGLGDTINFCRYVPLVAELGTKVVLEVQPPLKALMRSLAGGAQVIARGEPLPAFDVHCPLMSLPLAFKSTPTHLPAPQAYLSADPQQVQALAAHLGPRTQPRIGIVWSGNAAHRNDVNRSMPLATLMSALPSSGVQYYCLQKDIREADLPTLKARPDIVRLHDALQGFDGTAALLDQMDLVITVDTSIAHLTGAMGKPCWILLSRVPDWRWLVDRADCPWYPSARLFRQTSWGQWQAPLQEVAAALPAWLASAPKLN